MNTTRGAVRGVCCCIGSVALVLNLGSIYIYPLNLWGLRPSVV